MVIQSNALITSVTESARTIAASSASVNDRRVGRPGLATREHVRSLVDMMLTADIEDAVSEMRAAIRADDEALTPGELDNALNVAIVEP